MPLILSAPRPPGDVGICISANLQQVSAHPTWHIDRYFSTAGVEGAKVTVEGPDRSCS